MNRGILCYDDDPRQLSDHNYHINMGSFANIIYNLNRELYSINLLDCKNPEYIGFSSGIKLDFGFPEFKRFLIGVWETNILPQFLINERTRLEKQGNYFYFGLSKQIADVWESYGFLTKIVNIGVDSEYFKKDSNINKFDGFTILSTISLNFRSGIHHLIEAYKLLNDKSIKLIIKNTDERATKIPIIINELKKQGFDVEYICERLNIHQIKELMLRSHLFIYPAIQTSAGLPLLESAALELPTLTGDFCPTNIYPSSELINVTPTTISEIKDEVCQNWGLPYTFPPVWIDESKALIWKLDESDLATKILKIKNNYDFYLQKCRDMRKLVEMNWTWKNSTQQLIKNLYAS